MSALKPVIGPHSIISAQGESWKALRKRYNAGFAPSHLLTLLPGILDKTRLFLRNLDELAGTGQDFLMEPLCTNLTFDIIGSVIMDIDLKAQLAHTEQSQLVTLYRQLVESYTREEIGGVVSLNPVHKLRQYRLGKAVDRKLKELIIEKFEAGSSTMTNKKTRSVLALSLHDIDKLNPLLLQQTADQVKSFLFAGHDTTSIVLQWAFYELSRTPSALAKLRKEHDELFGPDSDPDVVAQMLLSRGDEVISKMAYTSAVIKEILRLYPPAATARRVPHGGGFFVKLPDGEEVCLDGMVLYNMHHAIQRDPEVYGSSSEIFRPERWLGNTDTSAADDDTSLSDSKAIPASGWRPFERGPRNCIGQELANLEARVILALAVRRYDFAKVDVGRLKIGSDKKPVLDETTGQYEVEDVLFNVSLLWLVDVMAFSADHVSDAADYIEAFRWDEDEGDTANMRGGHAKVRSRMKQRRCRSPKHDSTSLLVGENSRSKFNYSNHPQP